MDPLTQYAKGIDKAFRERDKQIQELVRHVNRLHADNAKGAMDSHHQGATHYAQVVMLGGYAGFFTLWTQARGEMSTWLFASTGALISVSIMTFVGFELYKSYMVGRINAKSGVLNPSQVAREANAINKYWPAAFLTASITGVIAGAAILFWYVYKTIVAGAQLAGAA